MEKLQMTNALFLTQICGCIQPRDSETGPDVLSLFRGRFLGQTGFALPKKNQQHAFNA